MVISGWVGSILCLIGGRSLGYESLMSLVRHTYDNALGCVTELFSGSENIWPGEAVPHQDFSSAGLVLSVVRGLLGREGDAVEKRIVFEPRFPADWDRLSAENYKVGDEIFSFRWTRNAGKIKLEIDGSKNSGFSFTFAPVLGPGTRILRAQLNGRPVPFKLTSTTFSAVVQPFLEVNLSGNDILELNIEPTVEIPPPVVGIKTGELNKGLKVIKTELREKQLILTLEGLAKEIYRLAVTNFDLIISVQGARLDAGQLVIEFPPEGGADEFIRHEVLITIK